MLFVGLLVAQGGAYGLSQSGPVVASETGSSAETGSTSAIDVPVVDQGQFAADGSESDGENESGPDSDGESDGSSDEEATTSSDGVEHGGSDDESSSSDTTSSSGSDDGSSVEGNDDDSADDDSPRVTDATVAGSESTASATEEDGSESADIDEIPEGTTADVGSDSTAQAEGTPSTADGSGEDVPDEGAAGGQAGSGEGTPSASVSGGGTPDGATGERSPAGQAPGGVAADGAGAADEATPGGVDGQAPGGAAGGQAPGGAGAASAGQGQAQQEAATSIDEQEFTLDDTDSSLNTGQQGTISGTITNDGPETVEDAILAFAGNQSVVMPRQSEVVLGGIEPGESVDFEYPVAVQQGTPPGERQVPFVVQYQDDEGNTQRSGTLNAQVTIDEAEDEFEVTDIAADLEPGERGTVEVTLENTEEDATDATINLQSVSPGIVFGQTANTSKFVGDWDQAETRTIEVQATAAESATVGEYPVQASVSYTDGDNQPARSGPIALGVEVGQSVDDFEVVNVDSNVPVADQGSVSVTLNNTDENATEATVSLQSLSTDLLFGRTANATQFVGDWNLGERRTIEFQVTASNDTERRSYPFQTSVTYRDSRNQRTQDGPYTIGVTPLREQAFSLANATSNLSVGGEGEVTATIVNEGPQPIRNAVVRLTVGNQDITIQQEEIAIGTLQAGEAANVSFPIEVSDNAQPGSQQFSFVIEYDDQEGNPRQSDRLETQIEIEPEQDPLGVGQRALQVQGENGSQDQQGDPLTPGGSKVVTIPVTNNRDVPLHNIEAQAFTNDPLSLAGDQAFVSELGPGETANLTFEVSASGDARPGTYPLSMDFQYETPDGDTKLSDTYKVPVEIEAESGGVLSALGGGEFSWLLIVLALLVAGAAGYVLYQRRN